MRVCEVIVSCTTDRGPYPAVAPASLGTTGSLALTPVPTSRPLLVGALALCARSTASYDAHVNLPQ